MNKLNRILLGIFGFQLLVGVFVCTRGGGPSLHKASVLLDDLDAEEVSKLQIFGAKTGDKTDVTAEVILAKEADGWVVSSHHDYPADAEAVKGLIGKLVAMKSRGPQTTSRSRHAQLEVAADKYQRKIVITTPRGEHTVYLGASPAFRQVAVRIDDADQTHAVADITTSDADTQVSAWIDPTFLQLPVEQMQSVIIEVAAGTLSLVRGPDLRWQLNGAPADQPRVEGMLGKLAQIDLADVAGVQPQAGWGLDQPQARITIAIGDKPPPEEGVDTGEEPPPVDAETVVLEVGAEKDGRYYLRALHKKHIVLVARSVVEDVVAATAEKLGAAPPPAPDGEVPPTPPSPRSGEGQGGGPPKPPGIRPPAPKPPGIRPPAPKPPGIRPPAPKPAAPKPPAPKPPAPRPAPP